MKHKIQTIILTIFITLTGCSMNNNKNNFKVEVDRFSDIEILRYQVPSFNRLTLRQKKFVYYLSQASLSGRDIIYDQNYKNNLLIRKTLHSIFENYRGKRVGNSWKKFLTYTKRVWFSNGIHHHYSTLKIIPEFSESYFKNLIEKTPSGIPLKKNMTINDFILAITPVLFDPNKDGKRVNLNSDDDIILSSSNNYYDGVTAEEVELFYKKNKNLNDKTPVWYGLNSRLIKRKGIIKEQVWKENGLYGEAIGEIIKWLNKAKTVAENNSQKKELEMLITYYKTGDLKIWDKYNIAWVENTNIDIDYINGFIEVYGDPKGIKASYEALVEINDFKATEDMKTLSENGQWFEDNAPISNLHKRKKVQGISYNVVDVAMLSGDVSPSAPIGINLPNSNWIRSNHGSKSVSLGNITTAYDNARSGGFIDEFAFKDEEKRRAKKYASLAGKMHTAMHEVLGHASGKIEKGIGTPKETLKNYASTIEEGRADLFGLYYILDPKLIEIGLINSDEIGKAEYDGFIRNGLMLQLRRLNLGESIEESHMRNRAFIANWVYEKGLPSKVIEKKVAKGKTYYTINDYNALRELFGTLLNEVQRITSKGDYKAARKLVEEYGVNVDINIHKEVLKRSDKLNIAPYAGFINPNYELIKDKNGKIFDIRISYPDSFLKQMLHYDNTYSFLPISNTVK